jgi:predicted membrane-bound mannosyltransferase
VAAAVKGSHVGPVDPKLVRFLAIYTVVMTVVYSAVPYKTPWCLLSFLHGMILLAGVGAVTLLSWARRPAMQFAAAGLLLVAAGHLAFETYRADFVYYADSRNPYVYAHATPEILTAVKKVREYAGLNGVGRSEDMPIQVIVPGGDYWPLPWYLRDLKVGYYAAVPQASEIGPLILISDTLEGTLASRLYSEMPPDKRQMYMYLFDAPYYIWSRPQVKLMGFVRKDLWEQHTYGSSDATQLLGDKHGK